MGMASRRVKPDSWEGNTTHNQEGKRKRQKGQLTKESRLEEDTSDKGCSDS